MNRVLLIGLLCIGSLSGYNQTIVIKDRGITYAINGSLISTTEQGGYLMKTYTEFKGDSLFVYEVHEYSSAVKSVYQYRLKTQSLSQDSYSETKSFIPAYKTYPVFRLTIFTDYMRNDVLYIIPPDSKYDKNYVEFYFASEKEMIGFRDKIFGMQQ